MVSKNGGGGWIRTIVRRSGQIYSLVDLTTLPPLHEARRKGGAREKGAAKRAAPDRKNGVYSVAAGGSQPLKGRASRRFAVSH